MRRRIRRRFLISVGRRRKPILMGRSRKLPDKTVNRFTWNKRLVGATVPSTNFPCNFATRSNDLRSLNRCLLLQAVRSGSFDGWRDVFRPNVLFGHGFLVDRRQTAFLRNLPSLLRANSKFTLFTYWLQSSYWARLNIGIDGRGTARRKGRYRSDRRSVTSHFKRRHR